jgi:hypothetical protein
MHYENGDNGASMEKSSIKYEKLAEKYLSQYLQQENQLLYLKDDYNRLNNHYNTIRSDLYNQKRSVSGLYKTYNQVNTTLKEQKELENKLEKENSILKKQIESYKKRKIVRLTNIVQKLLNKNRSKKVVQLETQPLKDEKENVDKTPEIPVVPTKSVHEDPKYLKDIKVAIIMDEFSYNSFKYEFDALEVEPENWREIFQTEKPDIFLCESAWHGINPETKPWARKISTNTNSKKENRTELLEILDYCREHSIPTIFWNKEDPTHYHNEVSSFADTASKFDHIFTSAEECIKDYEADYGHHSVHSLMFAAQPRLFNPIEDDERTNDVIFAGSWYAHHPRRCEEMKNIFDSVLDQGYKLKIYDRTYYSKLNDSYNFPSEYQDFVNPSVSHDQMAKVYKESKYAININTVTDSNTMFARRAFELILCNTLVLSNHSKGLEKLFKDNVVFMDQNGINLEHSAERRLKNLYNVLKNHTYTNRFKQILDTINYPYLETDKTVTLYYQTKTPEETENAIKHFQTIDYPYKKATIIQTNNDTRIGDTTPHQNITMIPSKNSEELEGLKNDSNYFIFTDTDLKPDFIWKALLHYSYIETKYGITEGKNFRFKKTIQTTNTLFSSQNFEKTVSLHINSEKDEEIPVYTIKI